MRKRSVTWLPLQMGILDFVFNNNYDTTITRNETFTFYFNATSYTLQILDAFNLKKLK